MNKRSGWTDMTVVLTFLAIFGVVLLASIGGWIFKSKMEASSFNSVTGKNVTTWQAMWIELRVQEGGK